MHVLMSRENAEKFPQAGHSLYRSQLTLEAKLSRISNSVFIAIPIESRGFGFRLLVNIHH